MRRAAITALLVQVLLVPTPGAGQTGSRADSAAALDKLRTPQSPAFQILGLSPANIEHPTTPAALATSLLSSLNSRDGGLLLPKHFGLELAPYWLWSHPTLTLREMSDQTSPGLGVTSAIARNLLQTLTVGIASADSAFRTTGAQPVDTSIYRLALSLRASPLRGHWVPGCVDSVETALARLSALVGTRVATALAASPRLSENQIEAVNQEALVATRAQADSTIKRSQKNCLAVRRGLSLDVALAGVGRYPQQTIEAGRLSGYAGWATVDYDWTNASLLAVARLGKAGVGATLLNQSYADVGGRFIGKWSDYAVSTEAVNRSARGGGATNNSWRLALGFDARLSEGVWLNTSFGRDFLAGDAHPLLAIANLQWNIGAPAIQPPSAAIHP